jgi:hypothetical protein
MLATQYAGKVLLQQQSGLCHVAPVHVRRNDHGMMPQWVSRRPDHYGGRGIDYALQAMLQQGREHIGAF